MDYDPEPYSLHEEHTRFIVMNCFYLGAYPLDRLLELLDDVDPDERHQILGGWMFNAWNITRRNGDPTEDEANAAEYDEFKRKCRHLTDGGVADYFVVQSAVGFVLTYLWDNAHGSHDHLDHRAHGVMLDRAKQGVDWGGSFLTGDKLQRMEERKNNIFANTQLWRRRYELFCTSVVKPLLDLPPELQQALEGAG